jgi:hypothetical protein
MFLELALVEPAPFPAGQEIRLRATYRSDEPVLIFHRMVMGWAPDELALFIDGPRGRQVSDRVMLSSPKLLPVTARDFVRVAPGSPCAFDFPLWSEEPLPAGDYSVRAHRPSLPWLDDAPETPSDVHRGELTSNPVALRVVP